MYAEKHNLQKKVTLMNFENLKNYIDRMVTEYKVPGVDCIVCKDHEQVFRYFAGCSDLESGKKLDGSELYFIFSMTKMITCVSALQLLERGRYLLLDPVSKYLPEFANMTVRTDDGGTAPAKREMRIRDLFTMSAGLDYELNDEAIASAIAAGKTTTRELVGAMANKVLCFEPGTRYRYSLCHDVLGALIEVWSGQKLGEYMQENVFAPLGMKDTFFGLPKDEERLARMATLYDHDLQNGREPKRLPLSCPYILTEEYQCGGAGLVSCTEDYALFADALACGGVGRNGNRILSEASVELLHTNHLKGKALEDYQWERPGYGYGLGVRTHIDASESGALSPEGEFGWDGAAGAFSMVDPKNGLSLVYFQHIGFWERRKQQELRNILYAEMNL